MPRLIGVVSLRLVGENFSLPPAEPSITLATRDRAERVSEERISPIRRISVSQINLPPRSFLLKIVPSRGTKKHSPDFFVQFLRRNFL